MDTRDLAQANMVKTAMADPGRQNFYAKWCKKIART